MTHDPAEALRKAARNIKTNDLPDDLRIPLHSLQADARCLFGRVAADGSVASMMADAVLERLSQIEIAALALANPSPAPAGGEGMREAAIAAYKAENTKNGWTGRHFGFEGGSLHLDKNGTGTLLFLETDMSWEDSESGRVYRGATVATSELLALSAFILSAIAPAEAPVTPPPSPDVAGVVERLRCEAGYCTPSANETRSVLDDAATLLESLSAEKGRLSELVQSFMEFDSEAYDRKSDRAKALIDLKKRARALTPKDGSR